MTTKSFFITLGFGLLIICCHGQDSIKSKRGAFNIDRYCLKINEGIQSSFFQEVGVSHLQIGGNELGFGGIERSIGLRWVPTINTNTRNIFGIKANASLILNGGVLGLDLIYQTDMQKSDFLITPKVGWGLAFIYFSYGYAFIPNDNRISGVNPNPFPNIGYHQFSLEISVSRIFLKLLSKPSDLHDKRRTGTIL